ncbi:hypothetical protein CHS0354_035005 [Potamilus streckersoni]|uniref:Uncharacterized protein n=1 Tax=Potamilus streckersoni TaxID=2493646 RepID=A0AAE0VTX1_9BIVA|nr:hypothetical protein CHS0354_035005 [Potamilus streckersoni]
MALWLNLLPKINAHDKDEKAPDGDYLHFANNTSTFDSSHMLINKFNDISPDHVPVNTLSSHVNDNPGGTTSDDSTTEHIGLEESSIQSWQLERESTRVKAVPGENNSTVSRRQIEILSMSSMPLSITVAVGCSLLFLNILIFAGVYYQKECIRKLRESGGGDVGANGIRKISKEDLSKESITHEIDLLMERPEDIISIVDTSNHKVSKNSPIYTSKKSLCKPDGYEYTALPTETSSPMHTAYTRKNIPKTGSQFNTDRNLATKLLMSISSAKLPEGDGTIKSYKEISSPAVNQVTSKNTTNNATTAV